MNDDWSQKVPWKVKWSQWKDLNSLPSLYECVCVCVCFSWSFKTGLFKIKNCRVKCKINSFKSQNHKGHKKPIQLLRSARIGSKCVKVAFKLYVYKYFKSSQLCSSIDCKVTRVEMKSIAKRIYFLCERRGYHYHKSLRTRRHAIVQTKLMCCWMVGRLVGQHTLVLVLEGFNVCLGILSTPLVVLAQCPNIQMIPNELVIIYLVLRIFVCVSLLLLLALAFLSELYFPYNYNSGCVPASMYTSLCLPYPL